MSVLNHCSLQPWNLHIPPKDLFLIMWMNASVCGCMQVCKCMGAWGSQKRTSDLELKLLLVVSHPTWVLSTEYWSSSKVALLSTKPPLWHKLWHLTLQCSMASDALAKFSLSAHRTLCPFKKRLHAYLKHMRQFCWSPPYSCLTSASDFVGLILKLSHRSF